MNISHDENLGNQNIWLSIDPKKVKQRVDRITEKLEKVRRELEYQVDGTYSARKKED